MNKKNLARRVGILALSATLITGLFTMGASAAGATPVTAQLSPQISIVVDGVNRDFYTVAGVEAHPITYNGTTYLPIRAIGELMGKNVNWDQNTYTVTIGGTRTVAATVGTPDTAAIAQNISAELRSDFTIVVDGTTRTFQDANGAVVYPLLYQGSTYLPIRAIGQVMGKNVGWNGTTNTVTLSGQSLVTDADSFNSNQTTTPGQTTVVNPGQTTVVTPGQTTTTGIITAEQAKAKALAHAGLTASQVIFVQCKLDWENGRRVYEVEFYTTTYKEYDYEIDATTGAVVSFDYDAEYYTRPQIGTGTGTLIGVEKAKSIALAKVPGATAANIRKAVMDYDDGRTEYEIEIIYKTLEYDFEIDAYTGTIISWDYDSIYD